MLKRIMELSVKNKLIVGLFTAAAILGGLWAVSQTPLEALPDLSDVQVIVQADYNEQAPRIVEDQVTYPIAAEMLKVPGASSVRGYSFFGVSFVYVIFEDGTDLYWARSRVLEYLNGIKGKLPQSVTPTLGPDATGLGWIFQYAIEDTTGRKTLAELRSIQDWYLRYALTAVPGVSEVATVGGFEKQYQVDIDPAKLLAYRIPVTRVLQAIQSANNDVGAMVIELSEREHMVRGLGYLKSISDIENVVVGATASGTPIRVAELGRVTIGPAVRRGVADLDGRGDAVGGIVVMRFGAERADDDQACEGKAAGDQDEPSSRRHHHAGVRQKQPHSDESIATLKEKLIEESIVVALVCLIFLLHARSALVAVLTLPVGILIAFIAMKIVGVGADIMSLGGIAIAIGAMIDAAIVMIENMHKHLERAVADKASGIGEDARRARLRHRRSHDRRAMESRRRIFEGGWPCPLLLAGDHHCLVPSGVHAGRTGRAAFQAACVHEDLCDGRGQSAFSYACASGDGIVRAWQDLSGIRKSRQSRAHQGVSPRDLSRAPQPVAGDRRCCCACCPHLDSMEQNRLGVHASAR